MSRTYYRYPGSACCGVAWWRDEKYPWRHYSISSVFGRDLNRAYRAKSKNLLRQGRWDDIPRHRRNERWRYL
jgi:hypothetical protein